MGDRVEHLYFEEEQRFRQPWIWAIVLLSSVLSLVVFGYALVQQLGFNKPFGDRPTSDTSLIITATFISVLAVGSPLLLYKMRLVTKVDSSHLHILFSPLRRRDIPLSDFTHWEARTYNPIRDYGGWGIKLGRRGWAYNVSGNRGVELRLANGKGLLVGSQRSEELAAAITLVKSETPR
jgi:hypothetical protein